MSRISDPTSPKLAAAPRAGIGSVADGQAQARELVIDERELLTRAAAGEEAAVRVLYRAHVAKLHRHAARILGPNDPDVEDVVQQAFLAALDGAAKFDGRSSVQTWLFGIVTRRALDAARSRWRRQRFSRLTEMMGFSSERSVEAPDRAYFAASEAETLLAQLPPMLRAVFVLHDVEGYTFAEISGLTDVGISTLHGRLLAARKRIDELSANVRESHGAHGAHGPNERGGDDA